MAAGECMDAASARLTSAGLGFGYIHSAVDDHYDCADASHV